MSIDLRAAGRVPAGGPEPAAAGPASPESRNVDRERLKRIAQEFESMLLVQVLRDMRRAGSWEEEGASESGLGFGGTSGGFSSLFETIDVELASHLSRVQGLGLSRQMEEAFDRMNPRSAQLPTPQAHVPAPTNAHESNPIVDAVKAVPKAVTHIVGPVAGAVTSAFGWRRDPFTHEAKFHKGVDLKAAYGQDVHAAAAGRVVFSGEQGGYGTTVVLEHADGTKTRYAHLSARTVEKGERIDAGAVLGRAGRSGRATGTHLHFEVIAPDGKRIQPESVAGLLGGGSLGRPESRHD